MRRVAPFLALLIFAALTAGCGYNESTAGTPKPTPAACVPTGVPTGGDSFNEKVGVLTTTSDGIKYYDFVVGTCPAPKAGQIVTMQYTGWLTNGTEFDSSSNRGPFSFQLGQGQVVPGWDETVATMHVGGKRRVIIPAALGYGANPPTDQKTIGPNATLVFDITLLSAS